MRVPGVRCEVDFYESDWVLTSRQVHCEVCFFFRVRSMRVSGMRCRL